MTFYHCAEHLQLVESFCCEVWAYAYDTKKTAQMRCSMGSVSGYIVHKIVVLTSGFYL